MKSKSIVILALASCSFVFTNSSQAADGSWLGATSGAWLTTTNWTGGTVPGATTANTDIATFNAAANPTVGIDFNTTAGVYHLGAIDNTDPTARLIGNSSATTSGVLTLNGATVGGVANTILNNPTTTLLTFQASQVVGSTMGVALGNATDNVVQITGTGGIFISGIISGSGKSLTRQGAGTGSLALSGANTYSGGTTVSTGTVVGRSSTAFGTGPVTLAGGILQLDTLTSGFVVSNPIGVTGAANIQVSGVPVTLGGLITISANTTFTGTATNGAFVNQITQTGGITSANNSSITITASNAGNHVFSGAINLGTGSVTRPSGNAAVTLSNASNAFSGGLFLAASPAGSFTGNTTITNNGAQGTGPITFTGGTGGLVFSNTSGIVANNILSTGGTGGVTKSGASSLTLSGANTYTGATTVSGGGTLKLDYSTQNNSKLSDTAVLTLGGTLDLSGGTHPEIVVSTTLAANSTSSVTRSTPGSILQMGAITAGTGASINFGAANIATTTTANNASGILGTWATVGSSDWAANSGLSGGLIAAFTGYANVDAQGPSSTIADAATSHVRIFGNGTSGTIQLGAATTTVSTLLQSNATVAATIDTASKTLATDIIWIPSGKAALTVGVSPNDGILTAATTPIGNVVLQNNSTAGLTVNSAIQNNATAVSLTKTGIGPATLAGANTYTGNTTVTGGTLNITGSLTGSTSTSTLALGTAAASTVVNVSGNMTLFNYTSGTVAGSNSVYNQSAGSVVTTPAAAFVQYVAQAGYGAFNLTGGTFKTNTGSFSVQGNGAGTAGIGVAYIGGTGTLDLTTATLNSTIAFGGTGALTVGPGGTVNRNGATGALFLMTNVNSYGVLNLAGGNIDLGATVLRLGNGSFTGMNGFMNLASGTLTIGANTTNSATGGNFYANYAGGILKASANLTNPVSTGGGITAVSTLFGPIDNVGATQDFTGGLTVDTNGFDVTYGNILRSATGNGIKQTNLTITGGSGYTGAPMVQFTGGTLAANGTHASGYALISGGAVTGIVITSPGTYTVAPTVTLSGGGGTGASVALSALSANAPDSGLTKTGAGTLTLNQANTYSGSTSIDAGTLSLSTANTNNDASTVTIAATGATMDLTYTGTDTVAKLFIGTTQQVAGVYGKVGSTSPIIGIPQITSDGTLTVTSNPSAGYSAWQTANSTVQAIGLDHDNDGVSNGIEYFLGGSANTSGFTALPGVTNAAGTLSVTWTKATGYMGTYGTDFVVETSSTLVGAWTPASLGAGANQVDFTGNDVKYTFPAGSKNFARLRVTGP